MPRFPATFPNRGVSSPQVDARRRLAASSRLRTLASSIRLADTWTFALETSAGDTFPALTRSFIEETIRMERSRSSSSSFSRSSSTSTAVKDLTTSVKTSSRLAS